MKCNTCYFAAIFHCAHPNRYIEPFIENCLFYKKGENKVVINENVVCDRCGKNVNINDTQVIAKGSRFICNGCLK